MAQLDWYIRAHLKPRHLQLLVAMDELRNLGKVAASAHVSPPAISKSLAELERGLGLKLFERTARGVQPTIYGECLIRHARAILDGLGEARDELRRLVAGVSGRVRVGVLPAVMPTLMPRALAMLKACDRGTKVALREGTMDALLPELLTGKLDLIVGRLPHTRGDRSIGEKELARGPIALVTGPSHPLARRRRILWAELNEYPWVLPPVGTLLREPLERAFERHGVAMPADTIETLSVPLVIAYLQLTSTIAPMAQDIAEHYQREGRIVVLPLELPRLLRPLGISWNKARPIGPSVRLLMQCLEDAARPLAAPRPAAPRRRRGLVEPRAATAH